MVIPILLAAFVCLSVGILLIGIGCVKEAFTPSITRRYEIGNVAVETTRKGSATKCPKSVSDEFSWRACRLDADHEGDCIGISDDDVMAGRRS